MTSATVVLAAQDAKTRQALQLRDAELVYDDAHVAILRVAALSGQLEARLAAMNLVRVFETTYISHLNSDQKRQELVAAFFDWLGVDYDKQIDAARNRACYESLFQTARSVLGQHPGSRVLLDIGCGPGTIITTDIPRLVPTILGYDISEKMCDEARRRGLHVLSDEEYASKRTCADIALTVYVMHYEAGQQQLLDRMCQHVAASGVWAMNFHKGIGLESFNARLRSNSALHLLEEVDNPLFGPILVVGSRDH